MGNPTHGACQRKNDGEHAGGDANRFQNNAGVEIDIWIQFFLDKITVRAINFFLAHRQFQLRIINAQRG